MKMILLPNGDRIRSDSIIAIRKGDGNQCPGDGKLHPRVIVDFVTGDHSNSVVLGCPDNETRDGLAHKINREIEEASKTPTPTTP
jgi:hypothetical protein